MRRIHVMNKSVSMKEASWWPSVYLLTNDQRKFPNIKRSPELYVHGSWPTMMEHLIMKCAELHFLHFMPLLLQ